MKFRRKPRVKSDRQKLVEKVDKLIGNQVKERDHWKCVRCGSDKQLNAAHVLPKGAHPRLRFEPENIITLCFSCHIVFWHRNPLEAKEWFDAAYPGRYE